jgi:hypothetical protein
VGCRVNNQAKTPSEIAAGNNSQICIIETIGLIIRWSIQIKTSSKRRFSLRHAVIIGALPKMRPSAPKTPVNCEHAVFGCKPLHLLN